MAYKIPVGVFTAAPALPAGASTPVILAAPGVGTKAYRIVGVHMGINRVATGIVDLVLQDTTGLSIAAAMGLSIAGQADLDITIPAPGILTTLNSGIQVAISSSAAAGNARITIYYYVDIID